MPPGPQMRRAVTTTGNRSPRRREASGAPPGGVRRVLSNPALMARPPRQQPLEHRLLLTATFCLLAGGAVMVYSASSARTLLEGQGDGTTYLVKYVMYGSIGLVAMQVLARHGLALVRRLTPWILVVAFVLLL